MKTNRFFKFVAAASLLSAIACSKEMEPEVQPEEQKTPAEQTETVFTYSFSIDAAKGADDSKALTLEGNTLTAAWAVGEEVTVYNETKDEELSGTLRAQSAGASTTLKGEISGTKGISANDVLTLKFLSPDYNSQEGTLEYIAAHCDYATASVTVTGVSGGNIDTGTATFENQQAIVHFELSMPNGYMGLYTRSLKIVVDKQIITVNMAAENKDVYVAVPSVLMKKIVIGASSYPDSDDYYYIKSSASFSRGEYYSIGVKMKAGTVVFNEAELNSAISANSPYIVLGCNIEPANCTFFEGSRNYTLDLCGHSLYRGLSALPGSGDGSVIRVNSGCSLTINDSSAENLGSIGGGWTSNGGGIYISSGCSVTINGGSIVGSHAVNNGGGIYNAGMLTLNGSAKMVSVTGNTCTGEGGGIWNNGTLYMQGKVQIKNNTYVAACSMDSNLCLTSGKKIFLAGAMENPSDIRVYCENYLDDQVVTSGYHSATGLDYRLWFTTDVTGFWLWYENDELLFSKTASGDPVRYMDRNWDDSSKQITETQRLVYAKSIASALEGDGQTDLAAGYYYVSGNVTTGDKLNAAGEIHLILCDGASLTANCIVADDYPVHIYGQLAGTGSFTAMDPDSGYPGIGCQSKDGKSIYITGGIINVKGASDCAGIGGGYSGDISMRDYHHSSSIHIYGGTVNATGGTEAAGIGGSSWSPTFGNIYIYGGTVNAQGGTDGLDADGGGAGIGGGDRCPNGGYIDIKGGTVNATGGPDAAGIGIGQDSENDAKKTYIHIRGGSVTATGGAYGAGIGGGDGVSGCNVFVEGGTVEAHAGTDAAGIGSGEGGSGVDGGHFEITGGFVQTWGNGHGAGLGAGEDSALGEIIISGGTLIAHGGSDCNAIFSQNTGVNTLTIGKTMRLRISETILPYSSREIMFVTSYHDIHFEPCPHSGSPCDWCMQGR